MVGVANMALCGVTGRRGCTVPRNACVACLVPVFMFAHPVQAAGASRDLSTEAFATTALIVLGALTLFSIGFDRLEEFMLRLRAKATKPVVRAMFQELSGLGCLGVVLFVVESTPGFTSISKAVYGDSHETDLASVIHDVHMGLFLVICIFLGNVVLLMVMAMRQQHTWKERELACSSRHYVFERFAEYLEARRPNPCVRLYRWLFLVEDEAYERVVYMAIRARFIDPTDVRAMAGSAGTVKQAASGHLTLSKNNALTYRKKLIVYAHETADPVRFDKHWGVSTAKRGDYIIVGVEGDVYACPKEVFEQTYEAVQGESNRYRKTGHVFARLMQKPFVVKTDQGSGTQRGAAGSYLVQDCRTGHQYALTETEFEGLYEAADTNLEALQWVTKVLPNDFAFNNYLTRQLGSTLAELVTLGWTTWLVLFLTTVVLWCTVLIDELVFQITNHAMGIAWSLANLLFMRKMYRIRAWLTPQPLSIRSNPLASLRSRNMSAFSPTARTAQIDLASPSRPSAAARAHAAMAGSGSNGDRVMSGPPMRAVVAGAVQDNLSVAPPAKSHSFEPDDEAGGSVRVIIARSESGGDAHDEAKPLQSPSSGGSTTPRRGSLGLHQQAVPQRLAQLRQGYESGRSRASVPGAGGSGELRRPSVPAAAGLGTPAAKYTSAHTLRYTDSSGARIEVSGDMLMGRHEDSVPLYTTQPQPTTIPWCASRPPNRHEVLFWGGPNGVAIVKEFVRANILFMSMFISVNLQLFASGCGEHLECSVSLVLVFLPQLINVVLLPRLITEFVLVSSIELLRKNNVANHTTRQQRTEKAMRALRMVSALRVFAARSNVTASASGRRPERASLSDIRGAAERVYGDRHTAMYTRRRREVKDAFAVFDRQNKGRIHVRNVQSLFELLGLGDAANDAATKVVAELGAPPEGYVQFNEFFDWVAAQHEHVGTEELTRDIFNIIDRDGSGDITATELRNTLCSLGAVMSTEDIMAILADADHDGNGTLSYHEFSALMRKHMGEDMKVPTTSVSLRKRSPLHTYSQGSLITLQARGGPLDSRGSAVGAT